MLNMQSSHGLLLSDRQGYCLRVALCLHIFLLEVLDIQLRPIVIYEKRSFALCTEGEEEKKRKAISCTEIKSFQKKSCASLCVTKRVILPRGVKFSR